MVPDNNFCKGDNNINNLKIGLHLVFYYDKQIMLTTLIIFSTVQLSEVAKVDLLPVTYYVIFFS